MLLVSSALLLFVSSFLPSFLPPFLPSSLPPFLHPFLPSSLPPFLPPFLLSSFPPFLLSSFPAFLLSPFPLSSFSFPPFLLSSFPPSSSFPPFLLSSFPPFLLVDFISASRRFYAAWACFNIFPKPISHHRGVRGLMVRVCFQQYMVYQQYINQRLLSHVWGRVVWANLRAMSPAIIVPVNYTLRSIPPIYHQREVCFIVARHWAVRSLPMVVLISP